MGALIFYELRNILFAETSIINFTDLFDMGSYKCLIFAAVFIAHWPCLHGVAAPRSQLNASEFNLMKFPTTEIQKYV